MNRRTKVRQRASRRGAVLIVALCAIAIASALLVVWARATVRDHQRQRAEFRGIQTDWLVESGVDRAAFRLSQQPEYEGEEWRIAADQLDGAHEALITIRVEPSDEEPTQRQITVRADYPTDPALRQRRTKQITVPIHSPGESS